MTCLPRWLLTAAVTATLAAPAAPPYFGMQLHSFQGPPEAHRRAIDLCRDAGIGIVRDECWWGYVEAEKGTLKVPAHVIENVRYTREQGIEVLLLLNYANAHYEGGAAPHTDEGRAAFVRYVETVIETFKGRINYYEIWNEPNIPLFWSPKPNADDYVALLKEVYPVCKRLDPDCKVVAGSLSGIDDAFLARMVELDALRFMDAFSFHPYIAPRSPEQAGLREAIEQRIVGVLAGAGRPLPLWITEVGWPTDLSIGVPVEVQSDMLVRTFLLDSTVTSLESHGWYWFGADNPTDQHDPEKNYGLFYADWTPKPGWLALDQLFDRLAPRPRGTLLPLESPLYAVTLGEGPRTQIALWSAEDPATLWLPLPVDLRVEQLGAAGAPDDLFPARRETCLPLRPMTVEAARAARPQPETLSPCLGGMFLTLGPSPLLCGGEGVQVLRSLLDAEVVGATRVALPTLQVVPGEAAPFSLDVEALLREARGTPDPLPDAMRAQLAARVAHAPRALSVTPGGTPFDFVIRAATDAPAGSYRVRFEVDHDGRRWSQLELPVEVTVAASLRLAPATVVRTPVPGGVSVTVESHSARTLRGTLALSSPHGAFRPATEPVTLAARGSATVGFVCETAVQHGDVVDVTATLALESGAVLTAVDRVSYTLARRAARPVVIDGVLDEWQLDERGAIVLGLADQLVHSEPRPWDYDDCRAQVYTAWDDEWFYLAAVVRDDIVSGPSTGRSVYKNDGLEIYFDTRHDADQAEGVYNGDDFQYGFFWCQGKPIVWNWSPVERESPGAVVAAATNETGYVFEGAIPWAELGAAAEPGLHLGFNVGLADDDNPAGEDSFGQERQWLWGRRPGAWKDPRLFVDLFLAE